MSKKKSGKHSQPSSKPPRTNSQNGSAVSTTQNSVPCANQLKDRLAASVPDEVQVNIPIPQTPSEDETKKIIDDANTKAFEAFDLLKSKLPAIVPDNLQLSVQNTPSQDEVKTIIDDANAKAVDILNDAKLAIIKSYAKNEKERAERQKPLLWIVVGLTALQLIAFNFIIAMIACAAFKTKYSEVILQLFEILKYYIGATVVELIGMVWFITRDTFSSNHIKMMKLMFSDKSSDETEKEDVTN